MTVLVLDSPELIARAAALEAAQATTDIQRLDASENGSKAESSTADDATFRPGKRSVTPQPEEVLALVV